MENERRRTGTGADEQGFESSFGARVRLLRMKQGWSQEHLARSLTEAGIAIHQTQIAKIEAGTRAVKLVEAVILARLLNVSLDALALGPVPGEPTLDRPDINEKQGETLYQLWAQREEIEKRIQEQKEIVDKANNQLKSLAQEMQELDVRCTYEGHELSRLQRLHSQVSVQIHEHIEAQKEEDQDDLEA